MWGSLKWDDDDLTPGNSKDGGLHNNLYDRRGKLKGAASFIPGGKREPKADNKPDKPRGKGRKRRSDPDGWPALIKGEVAGALGEIARDVARDLILEAKPHAKKLWEEQGKPALEAKRAEMANDAKLMWDQKAMPVIERQVVRQREKLVARKTKKATKQPVVVEGEVVNVEDQMGTHVTSKQ